MPDSFLLQSVAVVWRRSTRWLPGPVAQWGAAGVHEALGNRLPPDGPLPTWHACQHRQRPFPLPHARIGSGITVLGQGQRRYSLSFPFLTGGEVSQTAGLWCDRWTNGHTPVNSGWCANPMPATASASLGLTRSVVQGLGHGARGTTVGLAVHGRVHGGVPAGWHPVDRAARPRRPEGSAASFSRQAGGQSSALK